MSKTIKDYLKTGKLIMGKLFSLASALKLLKLTIFKGSPKMKVKMLRPEPITASEILKV